MVFNDMENMAQFIRISTPFFTLKEVLLIYLTSKILKLSPSFPTTATSVPRFPGMLFIGRISYDYTWL